MEARRGIEAAPGPQRRPRVGFTLSRRASGFTLIEILVVIGILVLLMGLTVGSILATARGNNLIAAEHLIADFVRQARHTARTSGIPVVIRIDQATRMMSGILRVPIVSESFEGEPALGATGQGWSLDPSSPAGWQSAVLTPQQSLMRGGSMAGFYLECRVRPPMAGWPGAPGMVPLAVVGPTPQLLGSYAGFGLIHETRVVQDTGGPGFADTKPPNDSPPTPVQLNTWELIGWIDGGSGREVSSLLDLPTDQFRDEPVLHASSPDTDVAAPIPGGSWETFGLLYDGERLILYRNGHRIGERTVAAPPAVAGGGESLWVGQIDRVGGPAYADNTLIDDVRLERLAAGNDVRLPPQVEPAKDYRLVAHPDGRVETFENPSTSTTVITCASNRGRADITVTLDGRVTSVLTEKNP